MADVLRIDGLAADLVEDRQEVVKRLDGVQRPGLGISKDATGGGEGEGGLDHGEWDTTVEEIDREASVGGPHLAGCRGSLAVAVEHLLDVLLAIQVGIEDPAGERV